MDHRKLLKFAPALALIALASCGAKDHAANQAKGEGAVENATLTKLDLTSSAFAAGQAIPTQYTCDGANQSPGLSWSEPPPGTKSFALVVDDPDAPSGTFRHWGAYDIPASTRSLAAGQAIGSQAVNGHGKLGYGGPCPPKGNGPHHYHFKLFALDIDRLNLGPNATVLDVENEAGKHAIAQGELIGTYERK
jgi:Raf kinase inhibitor-like YbhB/YbcL family protein